jgi:hypothetical protein
MPGSAARRVVASRVPAAAAPRGVSPTSCGTATCLGGADGLPSPAVAARRGDGPRHGGVRVAVVGSDLRLERRLRRWTEEAGAAIAAARAGATDLLPLPPDRGEYLRSLGRARAARRAGVARLHPATVGNPT